VFLAFSKRAAGIYLLSVSFQMTAPRDFYNDGFGWICVHCERELARETEAEHGRLLREGEAESKTPRLSNAALAKWFDRAERILTCPRCGTTGFAEI
jgi:hypothetical protein